jgi:hypothetical protein
MTGRCSVTSPYRTREIAGHPLNHAYQVIPKAEGCLAMSEECHVYIVRRADQEEWMAQAKEGEGIAAVCMRAAGEFTKNISKESLHCTCCNALFSPSNLPEAFIVLIPVKHETHGACSECSKNDNKWIFDNGPKRASSSVH